MLMLMLLRTPMLVRMTKPMPSPTILAIPMPMTGAMPMLTSMSIAMTISMDRGVGQVLSVIDEIDARENTLVWFMSETVVPQTIIRSVDVRAAFGKGGCACRRSFAGPTDSTATGKYPT